MSHTLLDVCLIRSLRRAGPIHMLLPRLTTFVDSLISDRSKLRQCCLPSKSSNKNIIMPRLHGRGLCLSGLLGFLILLVHSQLARLETTTFTEETTKKQAKAGDLPTDGTHAAVDRRMPIPPPPSVVSSQQPMVVADRTRTMMAMQNAGLNATQLDPQTLRLIPDWSTIENLVGPGPNILGLETCKSFQEIATFQDDSIEDKRRFIGVSGMFNSGTNVLAYLLRENCEFENDTGRALWQVPWGKHARATRRDFQTATRYSHYNKTRTLPVVMVRNPYEVLDSMCRNSYSIRYPKDVDSTCPHMVHPETGQLLPVRVGLKKPGIAYPSVVHFWNKWYQEYLYQFEHPKLFVRHEDLIVYPKQTVQRICECAGGNVVTEEEEFNFLLTSAKEGKGHGEASESNGLVEAWARLGRDIPFPEPDYEALKAHVDADIMSKFQYKTPKRQAIASAALAS
eukprot:scaffold535_cov65-Cylindrotheca_fusiformis.AAC.1